MPEKTPQAVSRKQQKPVQTPSISPSGQALNCVKCVNLTENLSQASGPEGKQLLNCPKL